MLRHALQHLFFRRRWRGFRTLHRLFGSRRIHCRSRHGVQFLLDPDDYVDTVVLREGFYESEIFEACRPFFTHDAVFWDIGGCFGLHAVTARTLYPQLPVHVFEPNPANQAAIGTNARINHADVRLWPVALSDEDGSADFFIPGPGNSGMATLFPPDKASYAHNLPVVTKRAQTLIDSGEIPAPTIIKLDVEGGEEAVLNGFGPHLAASSLRAVILECSPVVMDPAGGSTLRALLIEAGFELEALDRHEDTGHFLINVAARRRS